MRAYARLIIAGVVLLLQATSTLQGQTVHLRLHVIRLSDDNGTRLAAITPPEMLLWVQEANAAFARSNAGIKLHFHASTDGPDWEVRKSTTLNRLGSNGDGWSAANAVAAQHPGKVVVLVRHGDAKDPTGNGFAYPPQSGMTVNFVALPGFSKTTVPKDAFSGPWVQNRWLFGHELGHYLGLGHTFPGWNDEGTDTDPEALAAINKAGGKLSGLDGDSVPDSPPDAGTAYYKLKGWKMCSGPASYVIPAGSGKPGYTVTPMRTNLMSYFVCGLPRITSGQVARIRQTLNGPRSGVALSAPPSLDVVTQPAPNVEAVDKPALPARSIKAADQDKAPTTVARPSPRLRIRPPPQDSEAVRRPAPR